MIYLLKLPRQQSKREQGAEERRAGWALFRWVLSQKYPERAHLPLGELLTAGPHGKPFLKENLFYFNLSHSGGLVACAVEDCEVGVDVEQKRRFTTRLKNRICTPGERKLVEGSGGEDDALTRLWTMKESYMKYTGLGFAQGIRSTEFSVLGERPVLKTGDAFFASADVGEAFLTLCTKTPVAGGLTWVEPAQMEPFSGPGAN